MEHNHSISVAAYANHPLGWRSSVAWMREGKLLMQYNTPSSDIRQFYSDRFSRNLTSKDVQNIQARLLPCPTCESSLNAWLYRNTRRYITDDENMSYCPCQANWRGCIHTYVFRSWRADKAVPPLSCSPEHRRHLRHKSFEVIQYGMFIFQLSTVSVHCDWRNGLWLYCHVCICPIRKRTVSVCFVWIVSGYVEQHWKMRTVVMDKMQSQIMPSENCLAVTYCCVTSMFDKQSSCEFLSDSAPYFRRLQIGFVLPCFIGWHAMMTEEGIQILFCDIS